VSIGDALAAARREAGLTITQVSQRTCIRETIVRGIERGDYSACGGDFYARGHIRSIARAVNLDPDQLVAAMGRDKKARHDLTFVLDGPAGVEAVRGIAPSDVLATLAQMGATPVRSQ